MYVPEFWAGVLATVGIEFILCVILISISIRRSKNEDHNDSGNE